MGNVTTEDHRVIDMGDGTYGVARGDKLTHKGLGSETAALRAAAVDYITERVTVLVDGAVDHAVKMAFDSWERSSVHLLPAGINRVRLAVLIHRAFDSRCKLEGLDAELETLHEAQLQAPVSTPELEQG